MNFRVPFGKRFLRGIFDSIMVPMPEIKYKSFPNKNRLNNHTFITKLKHNINLKFIIKCYGSADSIQNKVKGQKLKSQPCFIVNFLGEIKYWRKAVLEN